MNIEDKIYLFINCFTGNRKFVKLFRIDHFKKQGKPWMKDNVKWRTDHGFHFDKNLKHVTHEHKLIEVGKLIKLFYDL